jgi:hypothetical protein
VSNSQECISPEECQRCRETSNRICSETKSRCDERNTRVSDDIKELKETIGKLFNKLDNFRNWMLGFFASTTAMMAVMVLTNLLGKK